jgi:UDP-2-acetamido-2-deoxy-ribo-hexuluronate aminotransferase
MIKLVNLKKEYDLIYHSLLKSMNKLHNESSYILNSDVKILEKKLALFKQSKYCVTCANGTDALILALKSLNLPSGSEVLVPAYSWISTASCVLINNLRIKFVDISRDDCCIDLNELKKKISKKTRAIIIAELYGNVIPSNYLRKICKQKNIYLIIDGAQSFGSYEQNDFYDIYTTSFFPAKSLGAFGDGGACFMNKIRFKKNIEYLRVNGQKEKYHSSILGINSRLDSMQAIVLLEKLKFYKSFIKKRYSAAKYYKKYIDVNLKEIQILLNFNQKINICTNFPILIKKRNLFISFMKDKGVEIGKNYPFPLTKQQTFKKFSNNFSFRNADYISKSIVTLPINPFITRKEQDYILNCLNEFNKTF